jgi:cell division protein FtsQ
MWKPKEKAGVERPKEGNVLSFRRSQTSSRVSTSLSAEMRAARGEGGGVFSLFRTTQERSLNLSMGSSTRSASADSGFYRPSSSERGRWASSNDKGSSLGRFAPRSFLSAGARKWAMKAAVLAILVAISVVLQGRVVEALQDLAGFHLAQVKVTGIHYLAEEEVLAASGLKPGEGMFRLDLKSAQAKVAALPWVKRVMFERRLPQNILISVEERRPAALLDAGALWGVDAEGRLLSPSQRLLDEDLPLLSGVSVGPEDVGNTRVAERLNPALGFLSFLKKEDAALYADVSEVQASHPDDLRVTFMDGTLARFGAEAGEPELRYMAAVLSDLSSKGCRASSMDFRFKDQVVVRLR